MSRTFEWRSILCALALLSGATACGEDGMAPPPPPPASAVNLAGEWASTYPCCGTEIVVVEQDGSQAVATKLIGDAFVPSGEITWRGNVTTGAAEFQVASEGFVNPQFIQAELEIESPTRFTVTRLADGVRQAFDRIDSAPSGAIGYSSTQAGSLDLFGIDIGEATGTLITGEPGVNESDGAWSPDGTRLAFTSGTIGGGATGVELDLVDAGGVARIDLAPGLAQPAWSPDESRIAAIQPTGQGIEQNLVIVEVGSGAVQTLRADGAQYSNPSWSPDGSTLVYARSSGLGAPTEIFTIAVDGTGERQLTQNCTCGWPAFSPDGSRIVYVDVFDVFVMASDGSGATPLFTEATIDTDPTWSPDGEWIAFTRFMGGQNEIWMMRRDGTLGLRFTAGQASTWKP